MKILMISSYYHPYIGGAELYCKEVAERFVNKGYEVHVLTKNLSNLKEYEFINKVHIHRIKTPNINFLRSALSFNKFLRKAKSMIKNTDLIHAHITYPNGMLAYKLSRKYQIPYIVTLQGDELMNYPEKKPLKLLKPLIKKTLRKADHVHCISNALKQIAIKEFQVNQDKITIIPNGVNLSYFKKAKPYIFPYKRPIAITVSRLSKKNGIDLLLKIIQKIPDISLVIIGNGPEKTELQDYVNKNKLNVYFLGEKENKEIPSLLKGADFFIRTPRTEGLGIAFLEAMASKIPIVTINVGGIPDIVINEFNGLTSNMNNEKIIQNILRLINDNKLRKKLIQNGSQFVKDFDWDNIFKLTQNMYDQVLKDRI